MTKDQRGSRKEMKSSSGDSGSGGGSSSSSGTSSKYLFFEFGWVGDDDLRTRNEHARRCQNEAVNVKRGGGKRREGGRRREGARRERKGGEQDSREEEEAYLSLYCRTSRTRASGV